MKGNIMIEKDEDPYKELKEMMTKMDETMGSQILEFMNNSREFYMGILCVNLRELIENEPLFMSSRGIVGLTEKDKPILNHGLISEREISIINLRKQIEDMMPEYLAERFPNEAPCEVLGKVVDGIEGWDREKSLIAAKVLIHEHFKQASSDQSTKKTCCDLKKVLQRNPTMFKTCMTNYFPNPAGRSRV